MPIPSFPLRFGRAWRSRYRIEHGNLLSQLQSALARADGTYLAVLMINLRFSNRLGLITGAISVETISRLVTERLERVLRDSDRFVYLSNDQICVLLPHLAEPAQAVLAANKILALLRQPYGAEQQIWLSPYIGIAVFPEHGRDAAELVMFADMAARIAAGTAAGYCVYEAQSDQATALYRGLDIELAAAIRSNALDVYYQPQIDILSGRCVAAEALLRWKPMGERYIAPPVVISLAESTGLIEPFTHWLLNTTFRHAVEFEAAGVPINVSINLSAKTLSDPEFPEAVKQALGTWGVAPGRITFEITEGSTIEEPEKALLMLGQLHGLGVKLSLDDFGTGYSSLAYLKRFPLNELKIDQMFVRNMRESPGDWAIVRAVVNLAHNFSLLAVAEGVEDQETLDKLGQLGCDLAQGYLFSKAIANSEFVDWYRARCSTNRASVLR
jgi:predicted signal transduction protein with EAL and GGDEF domain